MTVNWCRPLVRKFGYHRARRHLVARSRPGREDVVVGVHRPAGGELRRRRADGAGRLPALVRAGEPVRLPAQDDAVAVVAVDVRGRVQAEPVEHGQVGDDERRLVAAQRRGVLRFAVRVRVDASMKSDGARHGEQVGGVHPVGDVEHRIRRDRGDVLDVQLRVGRQRQRLPRRRARRPVRRRHRGEAHRVAERRARSPGMSKVSAVGAAQAGDRVGGRRPCGRRSRVTTALALSTIAGARPGDLGPVAQLGHVRGAAAGRARQAAPHPTRAGRGEGQGRAAASTVIGRVAMATIPRWCRLGAGRRVRFARCRRSVSPPWVAGSTAVGGWWSGLWLAAVAVLAPLAPQLQGALASGGFVAQDSEAVRAGNMLNRWLPAGPSRSSLVVAPRRQRRRPAPHDRAAARASRTSTLPPSGPRIVRSRTRPRRLRRLPARRRSRHRPRLRRAVPGRAAPAAGFAVDVTGLAGGVRGHPARHVGRPAPGRVDRHPGRAARARARVRDGGRRRHPARGRRRRRAGDARAAVDAGPGGAALDLRAQHRHDARPGRGGGLRAAGGLALPRGAAGRPATSRAAVVRTVETAGRAIAFSGLAVLIGLSGMWVFGLRVLSSIAAGGSLVVAVSALRGGDAAAGHPRPARPARRARPAPAPPAYNGARPHLFTAGSGWRGR